MYFVFLVYLYGSLALAKEYPENETVYLLFSSKKIFPPCIVFIFCFFPSFEMSLKILLCFRRSSTYIYSTSFFWFWHGVCDVNLIVWTVVHSLSAMRSDSCRCSCLRSMISITSEKKFLSKFFNIFCVNGG